MQADIDVPAELPIVEAPRPWTSARASAPGPKPDGIPYEPTVSHTPMHLTRGCHAWLLISSNGTQIRLEAVVVPHLLQLVEVHLRRDAGAADHG
jgi:hypothetical protein